MSAQSASIIRTTFESGIKRIDSSDLKDARALVQQNDERQRLELIQLNAKLFNYLNHVKKLESQNRNLEEQLRQLRENALSGIRTASNQSNRERIETRRHTLTSESQDRAKILSSSYWNFEKIALDLNDQIKFEESLERMIKDRLLALKEYNETLSSNLDEVNQALSNLNITDESSPESYLQQLLDQCDKLRENFLQKLYEKITAEDLLKNAEDQLSFIRALDEQESSELEHFKSSKVDARSFYRNELMGSIAGIRKDFEELKKQSVREFEQYYTAKTEIIRRKVYEENEKTVSNITDQESRHNRTLEKMNLEMNEIKSDLMILAKEANKLTEDEYNIGQRYTELQRENIRKLEQEQMEIQSLERSLNQLESHLSCISESNVSLNFEIHTYRRLIEVEELHYEAIDKFDADSLIINRKSTSEDLSSESTTIYQMSFNVTLPSKLKQVFIDSVADDGSVITLAAARENEQSIDIGEWCINQSYGTPADSDTAVIYFFFPEACKIRPGGQLRVFSRGSSRIAEDFGPESAIVADNVESWLKGTRTTRLIGSDGDVKHEI